MAGGSHAAVAVVDDDDAVRDSLCLLLSACGYRPLPFRSARQFLAFERHDEIGCALVDQHMPTVTGLELLAQLRQLCPELPVALMTASTSPELVRHAKTLGIGTVFNKPLPVDAVLDFLQRALNPAG